MNYTILIYETQADFAKRTSASEQGAYWGSYQAYSQTLQEAGVMVSGAGLEPARAGTTLTLRGEKRHVQDGPYAETKEQLGGYYVINVPDLDAALGWAARCPAASTGKIEVRPNLVMGS